MSGGEELAAARAYLRGSGAEGTVSVHDHLQALLLRIVKEKPAEPLRHFEALSVQIKQERLRQKARDAVADGSNAAAAVAPAVPNAVPSSSVLGVDVPNAPLVSTAASESALLASLQRTQDLLKKPKKFNEDGEEEEEEEVEHNAQAPDLQQEAFLLQQAGVGLGDEEWFRLSLSIQQLCDTEEGIESPRFWGKVFGRGADYYVLEAKLSDYPDDEEEEEAARAEKAADDKREVDEGEEEEEEAELPPNKTEPWGTGANEHVYWAANSPDGPWTRLPKVTPEQIIAARGMRRFFTGSLSAPVFGFPRFPWGESSYLRAQIARITASTALCPKGAFLSDDEESLIALENEEFRGVRASTLLQADNWVHYRAKLLQEGRVEAFVDENAEDEPDDDELTELEREQRDMQRALKEKPVSILSPASNDRLVGKGGRAVKRTLWKFHLAHHADQGLKPLAPPASNVDPDDLPADVSASQVVASAHSLLWPGAVSLALNKTHLHVYVGYGQKALNKRYQPARPPQPQSEWKPSTVPNKKGQLVDPTATQEDQLPPPADKRSPEELEEEEEEERQRLKRLAAEEGEPEEPVPEDEEEEEEAAEDEEEDEEED